MALSLQSVKIIELHQVPHSQSARLPKRAIRPRLHHKNARLLAVCEYEYPNERPMIRRLMGDFVDGFHLFAMVAYREHFLGGEFLKRSKGVEFFGRRGWA